MYSNSAFVTSAVFATQSTVAIATLFILSVENCVHALRDDSQLAYCIITRATVLHSTSPLVCNMCTLLFQTNLHHCVILTRIFISDSMPLFFNIHVVIVVIVKAQISLYLDCVTMYMYGHVYCCLHIHVHMLDLRAWSNCHDGFSCKIVAFTRTAIECRIDSSD